MTQRIGFILLPGYSSMAYVSAMEPLLVCNELTGEDAFSTFTVALSGNKTFSSLGNRMDTDYNLDDAPDADVWVVAGTSPRATRPPRGWMSSCRHCPPAAHSAGWPPVPTCWPGWA